MAYIKSCQSDVRFNVELFALEVYVLGNSIHFLLDIYYKTDQLF